MSAATSSLKPGARRPPLWLLVMVTFSGTLAMHMLVPALPAAAQDLNASMAAMQSTISLYILGLAAGQLFYGPLSDCFGRRPVLMVGLAIYTIAGLIAALAPDVQALIAARVLQALGGCAGLVLGRAIVRDTAGTEDTIKRLALMNLMTTIGPGLAPLLGTALVTTMGWRSIFLALAGLGVVNLLFTWRLLPETAKPSGTINFKSMGRDYKTLLGSPAFVGFVVGGGCATMAVYGIVVAAPFILVQELHYSVREVGFFIGLLMAGVSLGNAITSRLVGKVSIELIMIRANALGLASSAVFLAISLLGYLNLVAAGVLMFLFTLGVGMAGPGGITKAISVNAKLTGTAAGLYGFVQMLVGALCTALVGLGSSPSMAAGSVLVGAGVIAQIALRLGLKKEREAQQAAG